MQKVSSNKTTIYLIRHTEVFNPKRIIYVRLPGFGLSRLGYFQAHKLKKHFAQARIKSIYSSDLLRARKTAEIISNRKIKIKIKSQFTEIGFIKWQGLTYEERTIKEIEEYIKEPEKIDYLGESLEEAQVRMIDGIYEVIRENIGCDSIIVSHADPIILAVLYFTGKPLRKLNGTQNPNGSIYKLEFNEALQCEKIEFSQVVPAKKDWP